MNIPEFLIIHHTGGTDSNPLADTSNHTAKDVDAWHKAKGWDGIGYHWFIEKDGKIVKGRNEEKDGAHCIEEGMNRKSLGICLAGNFDATLPTPAQVESLRKLLKEKMVQYNIPKEKIVPHRRYANKTCYGNKLNESWARDLVNQPVVTPPVNSDKEKLNAIRKILDS